MPSLLRLRALPWLALFEMVRTTQAHLAENLDHRDRRRVADIVRRSKGDPRRVTARERDELRRIAGGLDLGGLARNVGPAVLGMRRGRRR